MSFSNAKHMKHMIAKAIACSTLLALPGCGIPALRKAEPGPPLPADVVGASAENSAQLGIEEFYNDRMLTYLIEKALGRQSRAEGPEPGGPDRLERRSSARSGAYLPLHPDIRPSAGVQTGASRFTETGAGILTDPYLPGQFFSLAHGNFGGGINLSWRLDIYRQLRNARDAAG